MRIRFGTPIISAADKAAIAEALNQRQLTNGGHVLQFEERFTDHIGGGKAIAVSSCTAGLYMALHALGVGPGDEVIVPALTFTACPHVVEALGAMPIFADVWPETGVMDPDWVEACITRDTKAIMAVHYAGRPAYMGSLLDIGRRYHIPVIEDCATALGATHSDRHVGLLSRAGIFSFHPVKHITTGEGGMIVTTDMSLYDRMRNIRSFGTIPSENGRMYDVRFFGLNFRMTEMQAALGISQLQSAGQRLAIRERNYRTLSKLLDDFQQIELETGGAFYTLVVMLPKGIDQTEIRKRLLIEKVESSVYYPGPLPMMTYYREKYGYRGGQFPNSERISQQSIALSVGPHLNLDRITETAARFKRVIGACA